MIYYTPRFHLATLAAPQSQLRSKIGGAPWGLPLRHWPTCCNGRLQKLVAQFLHEPPILDLGDPNAVLHLFQCQNCLGIWHDAGRAAFILSRDELGNEPSTPEGYDEGSEMGRPLIGEAFIMGWDQHDDGIPDSRLPEFFDEEKLWALHDEFANVDWFGDPRKTAKFGGSPRWTGNGPRAQIGPSDSQSPPFQFLFQLDEGIAMAGKPPQPDDVGCQMFIDDKNNFQRRVPVSPGKAKKNAPCDICYAEGSEVWYFSFMNLGSDGTLFAFINRQTKPHEVRWFWNR